MVRKRNSLGPVQMNAGTDAEYCFEIWEDGKTVQAIGSNGEMVHETKYLKDVDIDKQKEDFCKLIQEAEDKGYTLWLCNGCQTTYATPEPSMVCEEGHKFCHKINV